MKNSLQLVGKKTGKKPVKKPVKKPKSYFTGKITSL